MKRFFSIHLTLAALAWFGLAGRAHADQCVTAGDSVTLTNLLNSTSPNQATDLTIRLERGTYVLNSFISSYNKHTIAIRGGYDTGANCNGARWVEPTGTIIDFNGNSADITSTTGNPSSAGAVILEGVTLRHGSNLSLSAGYVNVDPYDFSKDKAGNITVSHTQISDFVSGNGVPLTFEAVKGTLTLDNSLLDSNVNNAANQLCSIGLWLGDDVTVNLRYLTAALYGARDFCLQSDIRNGNTYKINLQNSIIYEADNAGGSAMRAVPWPGQTDTNIWQLSATGSILQNYIDVHGQYSYPGSGASPNTPNFVDGLNPVPANRDFHLVYNSVAINTANPNVAGTNGTDMPGGPRLIGSKPDAGAYESQIDDTVSYVVTNTNDSGPGSLRYAIQNANKNDDPNTITFNLPCPAVIKLQSSLFVSEPLVVNGYSNPGAAMNSDPAAFNAKLCIIIEEQMIGTIANAFDFSAVSGGLTLSGIAFDGFYQPIAILGGSGHQITGNQFGGHFNGALMAGPLNDAIFVHGVGSGQIQIGGISPSQRNVIVGAASNGIDIDNTVTTNQCYVQNNLIGLDADGVTELGNGQYGADLQSNGCFFIGNRVAANGSGGLYIGGDNNVVQANIFGMNAQGNATFSPGWGVRVAGNGNAIGPRLTDAGFAPSLGNIAVFNDNGGVLINTGVRNVVRANLIDFNGGAQHDRSVEDVTVLPQANDAEPAPVIDLLNMSASPVNAPATATVTAHLDSLKFTSFRIDAYYSDYCTPTGHGHSQWYPATQVASTNGNGHVSFSMPLTLPKSPTTSALSLTATDMTGNTSNYSVCFPIAKGSIGDGIFKDGFNP